MDAVLRVGFVGAGKVNFGGEGPWDHASRLEALGGVLVVGIADPLEEAGQKALEKRRAGKHGHVYRECGLYSTAWDLLQEAKPDVVVIGSPPYARGDLSDGKDVELQCVRAGVDVLVEKPVSLSDAREFRKYVTEVEKAQLQTGSILCVGYMSRYHVAVRKMKDIISARGGRVMALNVSFLIAYEHSCNKYWWDTRMSGGPVVEQATHLCDVARYLVGDVDEASIRTDCIRDEGPGSVGHLTKVPKDCDQDLPEDARVPRVTMAQWRFTSGALGSLTHAIAFHGRKYETHIEVVMDGTRIYLDDLYTSGCQMRVRIGDEEEVLFFPDADPYLVQMADFLHAVRTRDTSVVQSTYVDAAKTYSFTCAIRDRERK